MKRVLLVLGFAAAFTACDPSVAFEPEDVEHYEITPPAIFRDLWNEISQCAGEEGDFGRVHWFRVKSDNIPFLRDGEPDNAVGMWQKPHNIYLADIVFRMMDYGEWTTSYKVHVPRIVKHEALHDLLQTGGHPPVFEKCGVGRSDVNKSIQALLELEGVMVRQ